MSEEYPPSWNDCHCWCHSTSTKHFMLGEEGRCCPWPEMLDGSVTCWEDHNDINPELPEGTEPSVGGRATPQEKLWGRHPLSKADIVELLSPGFPFPPTPAELCEVLHHWLPGVNDRGFHLHNGKLYGVEANGMCHVESTWEWEHTWVRAPDCPGHFSSLQMKHFDCHNTEWHHPHLSA